MKSTLAFLFTVFFVTACGDGHGDVAQNSSDVKYISSPDATEWQIKGTQGQPVGQLQANTHVNLFDSYSGEFLKYMSREFGINLGFVSGPAPVFSVSRANQSEHGVIKYGEPVALKFEGGGYLKYQTRDRGINLVWSNSPVLEWEIRGGAAGAAVGFSHKVMLYNRYQQQNIVYCPRELAVNLAWAKDCNTVGGHRIRIP